VANPALKVYIDWDQDGVIDAVDDVSIYAGSDSGDTVLDIQRGANFEGAAATPGTATVVLRNGDNRFTPGNTSGPLGSNVVAGKKIRIDAIYSSTTYPLFVGTIRRIVPNDVYPLEVSIFAEDELGQFDRNPMSLDFAPRSIYAFREAALAAYGLAGSQYSVSHVGHETPVIPTGADQESLLAVMADVNNATRSIDFVRPATTPNFTGFVYVVKDRATMLTQAAAASYTAAQIESVTGWEASDAEKVNYQQVQAEPYTTGEFEELLWHWKRDIYIGAGQSRVKWARWSDPILLGRGHRRAEGMRLEATTTGTASVTPTYYSTSAKLVVAGGGSGGQIRDIKLFGKPVDQLSLGYEESDLSAGDPFGKYAGQPVSSMFLGTDDEAKGLADYLTYIGTRPLLARPGVNIVRNLFPDILQREPGERITIAHGRLGLSAQSFLIESIALRLLAGGDWRLGLNGRLHPLLDFVTVGGTAAQGVGGTAILGY
jgi:hypothetical protein